MKYKKITAAIAILFICLTAKMSYGQGSSAPATQLEKPRFLRANDDILKISMLEEKEELVEAQKVLTITKTNGKTHKTNGNGSYTIFDDKMLLDGYTKKYSDLAKEIIIEMIKDDTLSSYKTAASVRVFKEKYCRQVVSRERILTEKILLRRLHRTRSPFVQVEIMHTLCRLDRYRYFKSMVPALIQKMNHYNKTVNDIAYNSLSDIVEVGNKRTREARIVFNTLRKILFLSRRRLASIKEPSEKLKQKLALLRWSVKVLGTQELKKLPKEVLSLL
ncbi:MAG: hypothetical protein P9X22_01790 [Candidatus Zapsychrus exili]|nr:hypothetical protein [Candidatus Zapsychrus exili]